MRNHAMVLVLAAQILLPPAVGAAVPGVRIGLQLEHNYSTQPGIVLAFDDPFMLRGRPRVSLSYSTTRIATAMGSNGLVEDRLSLAAAWHFRPVKQIDPYVQIEAGYARFNLEDERIFALLDNDAPVLSVIVGLETRWYDDRVGIFADLGGSLISSSTVYPFVASLGVTYKISGRARS